MILIVDDDIGVRTSLLLLLQNRNYASVAASSPGEALDILKSRNISLIILDLNFSIETSGVEGIECLRAIKEVNNTIPVILITGWGSIELAVKGMKMGANDFINKPWNNEHLLQSIETLLALQGKVEENHTRKQLDSLYDFESIIGEDPAIIDLLETTGRIAATDAPVLITGESGTGKELIAEAIHHNSYRKNSPFVKVNLGGISSSLFESEMFGHVRGAFTDAKTDRVGRFEMAQRGTIFLDEIGDLDFSSQVKLLRVLQDRTYEVLGSSRSKTINTRVICATNKNIESMVAGGTFREDLLYRINLIHLHMPPLRQRLKDIPLLISFFLNNFRQIYNRPSLTITPAAVKWLQQLPLPGNIRQLKNLVERSLVISKHDMLDIEDFKPQLNKNEEARKNSLYPETYNYTLDEVEIMMIKKALKYHNNKIAKAAVSLGISRNSLYRRLEKYNIPYDDASG
jgi:two-component system NtrC family response regulator